MESPTLEIEGTWEEVRKRDAELTGKRVYLKVLSEPVGSAGPPMPYRPSRGDSTGADLLRHAGSWAGDDLKDCLDEVLANRLPVRD